MEAACAPFQFALSTLAGVDCVGHAVRAATDANPMTTVLSVDGIGAYDHVYHAAMMSKLLEVSSLRHLLPFVRQAYGSATSYSWQDADGQRHRIHQQEGGEQVDPLMPMLLCLAIHNALAEVKNHLVEGEHLFAFLDDIYVLCSPERTTTIYKLLADRMEAIAGIQLHEGKTRVWNRAGVCPDGVVNLGPEVWSPSGAKILSTPVGSPEFLRSLIEERLDEERKLWQAIPWVPDLQCAWQILVQCAAPRCHHYLRTVPPSASQEYAQGHDEGMMSTMDILLGGLTGNDSQKEWAHKLATLPMRFGGFAMRSAMRMSRAAYWASWADALHMIAERLPRVADHVLVELAQNTNQGCIGELREAAARLDREGFVNRPGWIALKDGQRPEVVEMWEPGEWHHGWQYYASSCSEYHYRETVVLARVPQTRPTSVPILDQGLLMYFWVAQQVSNSSCNRSLSARWLWRGYDFLCNSLRLLVFAARGWTRADGTVRHVHGQVF